MFQIFKKSESIVLTNRCPFRYVKFSISSRRIFVKKKLSLYKKMLNEIVAQLVPPCPLLPVTRLLLNIMIIFS